MHVAMHDYIENTFIGHHLKFNPPDTVGGGFEKDQ